MYLIYGKNTVGKAVAKLCDLKKIPYEMYDDADNISDFSKYEAIIPSPGVPGTHAIYKTGKIIAELDFASQFLPKDFEIIAITGTDGKSTTAWMIYSILQKYYFGKKKVYLSGNFEIPLSETITEILEHNEKRGSIVVEISSFMSHAIKKFAPDYTIFTNLKVDHLNWHRDLQEYLDAKMNLVHATKKMSVFHTEILDFAKEKNLKISLPENVRLFSADKNLTPRDWTNGEDIAISGRRKYKLSETQFSGLHNALNILSVTMVTNEMKMCSKKTKNYFWEISGLSHRIETIGEKNGITFVDDSKSTSAQSLEAALGAFGDEKNLLLIVGGSDKWDTFSHLAEKFAKRVKKLAAIGATKNHFIDIAKSENIKYIATDTMSEAVKFLYESAESGDILMLSPGCASFGLFKDYLDRANRFKEAIQSL